MGACGLPDMYTINPWASRVHIMQITHTHVATSYVLRVLNINIMLNFKHNYRCTGTYIDT